VQFFDPSVKATSSRQSHIERKYNFPFDQVPLGKSFHVGKDQVKNLNVLRTITNRNGTKLQRKFKVIDHGEAGYEVFYKEEIKTIEPPTGLVVDEYADIPGRYRG